METKALRRALASHKQINDRFTFDDLFRRLLRSGFTQDESKNLIVHNCALSALVFQERIENGFYQRISEHEKISADLLELYKEALPRYRIMN